MGVLTLLSSRLSKPTVSCALFVVCTMLTAPSTVAQTHEHQHPDLSSMKPLLIPPVRYNFRGDVKPESTLVRGLLEVEYANQSPDRLNEIRFSCATPMIDPHHSARSPEPPYLKLDSVLSYGVPLSGDELRIDGRSMSVVMPRPLPPNERAFFIMTFETRLKSSDVHGVMFRDWYPRVSTYHNGRWYDGYDSILDQAVPEYADYAVALQVDSAYSLVYPGELINDKEHYGLLPPAHNDSVYIDIVNQHQQEYAGIKYKPVFESGRKNFYIRSKNDIDFSFVAGKNLLRDRAFVDSLTIEACYPPEIVETWAGFIASEATRVMRGLEEEFGPFPYRNLRIAASSDAPTIVDSRQLIVLSSHVTDTTALRATLSMQISQRRQPPAPPDSSDSDRGRTVPSPRGEGDE